MTYREDSKSAAFTGTSLSSLTACLLPNGLGVNHKSETTAWYTNWLVSEVAKLPSHIFNIFHLDHERCTPGAHGDLFVRMFLLVAESVIQKRSITIDEIIGDLLDEGILPLDAPAENLNFARYFIFTLLGYQTMLYSSSPLDPVLKTPLQLRTVEDLGCCRYTHACLTQDIEVCAREPLSELLMGFGVLLPSKNLCLDDDQGLHTAFQQQVELEPKTFNAYGLHYIAGIKIKWTDALACHLEFNSTKGELSLFRFPSFCQFSLANYTQGKGRGSLHACATTSRLRCQWATEEEINHFLLEVLLSYRLLFGQHKKSRAFFRSEEPFLRQNRKMRDPLLSSLCSTQSWDTSMDLPDDLHLIEKKTYYLSHDFPILRYRLVVLQKHLSAAAPRTWLQLWRDNRSSANWMTFWAVIVFGAFGSLMALLQVVLQFVQILR